MRRAQREQRDARRRGRAFPPYNDCPRTLAIVAIAIVITALALATGPDGLVARAVVADAERIGGGELWRLATGPFVHVTWGHLVRDLALVAIPGIAYEAAFGRRRWALLVGAGVIAPAAAVLAAGDATRYFGLSGLSHAVLAAALAYELRHRRGRTRAYVAILVGLGAVKIGYELVTGAPAFPMALGAGVVQVPLAHAVGAAVGLILGTRASASACGTR